MYIVLPHLHILYALFALVLGEDELAQQVVGVKPLRGQGEQQNIAWDALAEHLEARLKQV